MSTDLPRGSPTLSSIIFVLILRPWSKFLILDTVFLSSKIQFCSSFPFLFLCWEVLFFQPFQKCSALSYGQWLWSAQWDAVYKFWLTLCGQSASVSLVFKAFAALFGFAQRVHHLRGGLKLGQGFMLQVSCPFRSVWHTRPWEVSMGLTSVLTQNPGLLSEIPLPHTFKSSEFLFPGFSGHKAKFLSGFSLLFYHALLYNWDCLWEQSSKRKEIK